VLISSSFGVEKRITRIVPTDYLDQVNTILNLLLLFKMNGMLGFPIGLQIHRLLKYASDNSTLYLRSLPYANFLSIFIVSLSLPLPFKSSLPACSSSPKSQVSGEDFICQIWKPKNGIQGMVQEFSSNQGIICHHQMESILFPGLESLPCIQRDHIH
jgi:hypothetical protein